MGAVKKISKKLFEWLVIGVSWIMSLPTLISPFWTISGFLFQMFWPLGMVQMFHIYLGLEPRHPKGWDPWLRFYIPWIPIITSPLTRWLVGSKIPLPSQELETAFNWVGAFLIILGLSLLIIGLTQIAIAKIKHMGLVEKGLYAWVRHPQYLGICLWIFGDALYGLRPMDFVVWLTLVFLYFLLAESEERSLQRQFGKDYLEYKKEVPFIFPLVPPYSFRLDRFSQGKLWRTVIIYGGLYLLVMILLLVFLKTICIPLPQT